MSIRPVLPAPVRSAVLVLSLLHPLATRATTNNLVQNPSFESGAVPWTLFGQGSGVQYALTNDAVDGVKSMRAGSRTNISHHVMQDVLTNLLVEGSGFYGIEFSVKMPAPGSARATLQVVDDTGSRTLILAEKIVGAETGRWVTIRGGRDLSWQGTVSLASLRFEIGQITELVYPDTQLDQVRIVRDTDRDGLTDDRDPFVSLADANTNSIPDGWESDFQLPDTPGATDADGDGFSNAQEFWAATNPTNALSKPGDPANTNATREARALLTYLALLPSFPTQRLLVGQVVTDTSNDYASHVVALAAQTGRWPAMLGVVYDMIAGPINHAAITPVATNYWNDGGMVHVQWNPDNPWNGGFSGDTNNIDFPSLFTPGTASHSNYLAILDEVAVGLRQLGDAGMTVLFRPLCECNSTQNWYQRRARNEYIPLFRWTFDYLAISQGLNHVLWVYDALNSPHQLVPVTYYYPGDDVVDVFGVNMYDDDWVPAFDLDRLSRDYPKPLAIPEGGPLTILGGTFTNTDYIVGISNSMPRLSYFAIYNSFTNQAAKLYGLVSNTGSTDLFDHPWVITRDEISWRYFLGPFGRWQLESFSTNANRPWISSDTVDPDSDGERNIVEYASGSDPLSLSPSSLTPGIDGLSLSRNTAATDVTIRVEASADIAAHAWSEVARKDGSQPWQGAPVIDPDDGSVFLAWPGTNTVSAFRLLISRP